MRSKIQWIHFPSSHSSPDFRALMIWCRPLARKPPLSSSPDLLPRKTSAAGSAIIMQVAKQCYLMSACRLPLWKDLVVVLLENCRVSLKSFAFSSKNSAFFDVFSPFFAHGWEKINSRSSTLFATRECRQDSSPTSYYISVGLDEATQKKEWNSETSASTNENGEAYLS